MITSSYVIPYAVLLRQLGLPENLRESDRIQLTPDQLLSLIRKLLASVSVDEAWYTATYQDVEEAMQLGKVKSAKEHFVSDGYFEGRLPGRLLVDEEFYVSRYRDVAEGIEDGEIASAQEHFENHGFVEGRLPFKT